MSKRILIITDSIAPPAYAPRIVSLCRHLSDRGWECAVFSDCEQGVPPFSRPFGKWYQMQYYSSGSTFFKYIADKLFGARERQMQAFIEAQINVAEYDVIFCSTCYYFPLQTTFRLAKKYHKPFVVDIRDLAEQWGNIPYNTHSVSRFRLINTWIHRLFTRIALHQRNRVLRAARHVVTISPWHQQLLRGYNPDTHLIYNGFDGQDFYPKDVPSDKFVISYSGKIYNLLFRDPRLLLEALQHLLESGRMARGKVELVFHIDQGSIAALRQLVAQYRLSDICTIDGYIPKEELLPLMHRSSVLLVLSCQSTPEGAHGIMGTKFYEALGVEKPVLCVRSDEECLAQVIEETHAGLAGVDAGQVARFLADKYQEWQRNGFTRQEVQHKDLFMRETQCAQIETLL
jgi:glycosyltransferase involved in cell wall biosynthesis